MKNTFLASTLIIASLLSSASVFANEAPSWNYVEGSFISIDTGDDLKPTGFGGKYSTTINDSNVFFNVQLASLNDEINNHDVDVVDFQSNIGYKFATSSTTDLFASVGFERMSVEYRGYDTDEDATLASIGGVTTFKGFELKGSFDYIDTDFGSETGFNVTGYYNINNDFSVGVSLSSMDDVDTTMFSFRYAY